MTKDDIIRMAKESGIIHPEQVFKNLECFFRMAQAAEREECAKVCEESTYSDVGDYWGKSKAAAIRARGQA